MDEQLELFKRNTLAVFGVELKGETIEECREELKKAQGERADMPHETRASQADGRPKTFNEEERTVETVVASELPVIRFDWWEGEYYNETLAMEGVDLSGAKNGIPLLNSHNRWDAMKDVLGTTSDLHVEGDKLVGTRRFSTTAEKAFTLAREGHLRGQSVGYRVEKSTWLKPGEKATIFGREFENKDKNLRLRVATKWSPVEDSIVIMPADHTTGMRSAEGAQPTEHTEDNNSIDNRKNDAGDGTSGIAATENTQTKEQTKMAEENKTLAPSQQPAATTAAPVADNGEEKRAATAAERSRQKEIRDMCARFQIGDELCDKLLDDGTDVNEARKAVMDELDKRSKKNEVPPAGQHVTGQRDYIDQVIDPLADAMCVRGGVTIPEDKLHKDHKQFTAMSIRDICLNLLLQRGESPNIMRLTTGEVFNRAIATGDLPVLLKSTAQRSLMAGWEYQDETYEQWTGTGGTNDLREKTVAHGLANFQLKEVREGQDYEYADMSEESLSFRVAKYGRMIAFTEEASINDDLDQITIYPEEMGRACRALEAELAYNYLINNPDGPDGTALFSSTHKNLASAGAKPTEASIDAALLAMSVQKDASGKLIRVVPRVGVFPAAWKSTVDKLLNTEFWNDANAAATQKNTAYRVLGKLVFEPRLDAAFEGSNLPWFIIGQENKGVCIVHLRGYEKPQMTTEKSFNIDGFRAKIRHFCGSYVASHQALYKNPGTTIS